MWWGVPRDTGLRDRRSGIKWIVVVALIVLFVVVGTWLLVSSVVHNRPGCNYSCAPNPTTSIG